MLVNSLQTIVKPISYQLTLKSFLCYTYIYAMPICIQVQEVQPDSNTDIDTSWKNSCFISSRRSDFHMPMLTLLSVDEILLPKYVKSSTDFKVLSFNIMISSCLKHEWNTYLKKKKKGCCMLFRTNPRNSTPWNSNCMATCFPSYKVRLTIYAGYCLRNSDKLISEVLLRAPTHEHCVAWSAKLRYFSSV